MFTGLDHIIIGVNNLEEATSIFSQKLGLVASGGGVHPSVGTSNRIIVIGDTYLELITVSTPEEAQPSITERLAKGDGYLNFVLTSNDIEADSKAMAQRGVTILGPKAGQLTSSDGKSRGWSRIDVERPDMVQSYPFIIQHDSTGQERRFRLAGWTEPPPHPLGATSVLSTTIAVQSLAEAAPHFQRIYGLNPSLNFTGEVDNWDTMLVAFPVGESGQSFELAEPLPLETESEAMTTSELLPEPGSLAHYLKTFGESLCRMTLAVQNLEEARRFLDKQGVVYTYSAKGHASLWIHPSQACGAAIVLHQEIEE